MNDYDYNDMIQYENYDVDPVSPYSLLQRMAAWNKEVRITVSDLAAETEAQIAVLSGEISLRVLADEIIQSINLSEEGLKIDVTKMDVSGLVTFTALGTNGATIIHGGNILTGTVLADRIYAEQLSAISANLGVITAGTINAVTINGANIAIQQDVEVGRYLRVGRGFDTMSKGITFKGTAVSLDVFGDSISINAQAITLNGVVSASNLNATTLQGNPASAFALASHSHFYPMQAYLPHQAGTTFEVTSTGLILRTPSGTTKTFTGT